jgi:hypothetical protein
MVEKISTIIKFSIKKNIPGCMMYVVPPVYVWICTLPRKYGFISYHWHFSLYLNFGGIWICTFICFIQSTTVYPLRNGSDIIIPFCKLSITCDSFIPSTIRQWNSLNPFLRNMESIAKFKTELRKQKDIRQVPKHFEIGPRKLNIGLTQLRCFASFLNYDLFQVNIISDPSCRCGANR